MQSKEPCLSYNELIDSIGKFLEVSFHVLLCVRGVYPNDVFAQRQVYNCTVFQSRNPAVNEWISNSVGHVKTEISKSTVEEVVLVIYSQSRGTAFERYRFRLDYILDSLPGSSSPGIETRFRGMDIEGNFTQSELEEHFRRFIQKLMVVESTLAPLPSPDDLTFTIAIELKEPDAPQYDDRHLPPQGVWVPADDSSSRGGVNARGVHLSTIKADKGKGKGKARQLDEDQEMEDVQGERPRAQRQEPHKSKNKLLTISSLDSGVINLALWVEENPIGKLEHDKSYSSQDYPGGMFGSGDSDFGRPAASHRGPRELDEPAPLPTPSARKKKAAADGDGNDSDDDGSGGYKSPGDFDGF